MPRGGPPALSYRCLVVLRGIPLLIGLLAAQPSAAAEFAVARAQLRGGVSAGAVEVGGDVDAALTGSISEPLSTVVAIVVVPFAVELGVEFHRAAPALVPLIELVHCF